MSARERLEKVIYNFNHRDLNLFMRLKTDCYAEVGEELPGYKDDKFQDFKKIGEIRFETGENLVVVCSPVAGDLSERSGKKAQYDKAKRILKDQGAYDAGFFIFHDPDGSFRFSLVYGQAEGVKKSWSNFRRFTYFVSTNQINRTFLSRVGAGDFSSLEAIKDAFSVEKVNKEFYELIAKFFYRLTDYEPKRQMTLPSVSDDNKKAYQEFAVRLIGRAIFCWFLKHKRSPSGDPLIPKSILSSDSVRRNSGYYHGVLEKLFFEVLNTPRKDRKQDVLADSETIPFLNGGLFEHHGDDYYRPSLVNTLVIPDNWFEEFFGLLEQYNFTIDENSAVDAEVSVDPEMLGRIFENLLAEVNPETGETARRATGSYYTPRPIVDYMVDRSLTQYLLTKTGIDESRLDDLLSYEVEDVALSKEETDAVISAIDQIKIIDPACGSGAFPMGMLHKMLLVLQRIDPDLSIWLRNHLGNIEPGIFRDRLLKRIENENWEYIRKLLIVEKSIYGVDIQTIAVEISKLRFFLSLVVDEKIDDDKDNRGIEALPNLEFKFVAANTLIGLPPAFDQQIGFGSEEIAKLRELRVRYLRSYGEEKKTIESEFLRTRGKLVEKNINWGGKDALALQLANWDPFKNKASGWFDPEWMFGVEGGFDIVIGNPPYGVSIKGDERKATERALGKVPDYEIYYFFIQLAHKLLKQCGHKAYIIPNTILFNVYAEKYRLNLLKDWNIKLIIDCTNFKLFEAATIHNVITLSQKDNGSENIGYKNTNNAHSFFDLVSRPTLMVEQEKLRDNNSNWGLVFKIDQGTLLLRQRIKGGKEPLGVHFPEISQGLIAYDKYQGQTEETILNRIYHYREKAKSGLKQWLWGEDVKRYVVIWNQSEYIDYCDGIANPREPKFFKGQRILVREITNPSIYAACTSEELYHDPAVIVVKKGESFGILCLLGILNSKLASFYHFNSSPKATKGSFPKILVKDIREFPLPSISTQQTASLEHLVSLVVAAIKDDPGNVNQKAQVAEWEHRIDQLVYDLYGLTPEEIRIVDGSVK